jgi:hypothetical protein
MIIALKLDQYEDKCIYFCEPVKNKVIEEGNFIRILYTNQFVTLNGVYIIISFNDVTVEKYYNKYKCNFNVYTHKKIIDKIRTIEENILNTYKNTGKFKQMKIYEQLQQGIIKIFNETENKINNNFILKISGIWETPLSYGLTYKFIKVN